MMPSRGDVADWTGYATAADLIELENVREIISKTFAKEDMPAIKRDHIIPCS